MTSFSVGLLMGAVAFAYLLLVLFIGVAAYVWVELRAMQKSTHQVAWYPLEPPQAPGSDKMGFDGFDPKTRAKLDAEAAEFN